MKDYYKILEVSPNSSLDEIKKQYRFLVNAYHPDKFQNPDQKSKAEDKVKEINEAFDVLKDDSKRREYNSKWFAYINQTGTIGEKPQKSQNVYEPQQKKWQDAGNSDKTNKDRPVNSPNIHKSDNQQNRKPKNIQIAFVVGLTIVAFLCLLIYSRPTNTTKKEVLSSFPTQKSITTATKIIPTKKPSPTYTRVYTKTPTNTPGNGSGYFSRKP